MTLSAPLSIVSASEDLPDAPAGSVQKIAQDEQTRVLLVGDSTVCDYPAEKPTRGWGQPLPSFFSDKVSFLNAAAGGRSSKSFIAEGRWDKGLAFKPDYVFIQFGHNDQPGKGPERETDPATTYRDFLKRYIKDAKAIGAQPILVTSVARRTFKDGKVTSSLWKWVDAVKAVAAEEGVPVIDLHAKSIAAYEQIGDAAGADLNNGEPKDLTHFSQKGADLMAKLVVEELPKQVPSLAAYLKTQP